MDPQDSQSHKANSFMVSILISVVAVTVSCLALGFTIWNETKKETTTLRQSLTDVLEQITDIDREAAEFQATLSLPDEQKDSTSFSFMNRKFLLLRQAEELYKKLGDKTTVADDALISVAYFGVGEFKEAESHMKGALEKAKTRIVRASVLRSLATLAVARGDHSQATELYDKALQEIGIPKNDMENNFKMKTNLFKVDHAIARNDYDSAATSLEELVVDFQNLGCTSGRSQWFMKIYPMVQMLAPHLEDKILTPPIGDGKAKCIYDSYASEFVKTGKLRRWSPPS